MQSKLKSFLHLMHAHECHCYVKTYAAGNKSRTNYCDTPLIAAFNYTSLRCV